MITIKVLVTSGRHWKWDMAPEGLAEFNFLICMVVVHTYSPKYITQLHLLEFISNIQILATSRSHDKGHTHFPNGRWTM